MRNIWILAGKELRSYFTAPVAYVILAAYMVASGFFFWYYLAASQEASMRFLFGTLAFVLLLLTPLLTMRQLSEEQRSGTIEILLTGPVRDIELVLGKFLFSLIFLFVMLGLTLYYLVLLNWLGEPELGPIASGYLGLFLFGAAFLAIGLLMSSLTQNQIIAAVLTFVTLILLWTIDGASGFFGGPIADAVNYLSLTRHAADFSKGVVDTRDIVYYITLIVTGLFLTARSLETRRWR